MTTTVRITTRAAMTIALALATTTGLTDAVGQTTQAAPATANAPAASRVLELSWVSGLPEDMRSQGLLDAYQAIAVAAAKAHGDVDRAIAALSRLSPQSVALTVEVPLTAVTTLSIEILPGNVGEADPGSPRKARYRLGLRTGDPDPAKLLDAIVEQVRSDLVEHPPVPVDQVQIRLRELMEKQRQVYRQKTLLEHLAAKRAELNLEQIVRRMDETAREDQRLKMDLAAKEARSEAIRRQLTEADRATDERMANDAVKTQLELAAKLRRAEAETLKKQIDAGQPFAPAEHTQALVRLAEAEARVAEREAELAESALIDRLNGELSTLMIDLAELNARRSVLRDQVPATDLENMTPDQLDQLTRSNDVSPGLTVALDKREGELNLQEMALRVVDAVVVRPDPPSQPSSHPPTTRPGRRTSATPG